MSKIAEVMNTEIARLARKEIKKALAPLLADIRAIGQRAAGLEKDLNALKRQMGKIATTGRAAPAAEPGVSPEPAAEPAKRAGGKRLTPYLMKKLRNRLKISQTELAQLLGVSQPAVASWEQGRANPRGKTRDAIIALRDLDAKSAREALREKATA